MKPFRHQQYSFVKVKLMSRSNYAKNLIVRTLAISLSTGKYIKVLLFQLGNQPYNELFLFFSTSSERKYRTLTSNDRSTFDRRSFAQLQLNELNDRDTGKLINLLLLMNYLYNFM